MEIFFCTFFLGSSFEIMLGFELPHFHNDASSSSSASSSYQNGNSPYRASPWNGYHRRHLVLLANRHRLHKYNLPRTFIDENGKVALKHANGHLTRFTDQMSQAFNLWLLIWLQYLAYCWKRLSGLTKMQKAIEDKSLSEYNNNNHHHNHTNGGVNGVRIVRKNSRNNGVRPKSRRVVTVKNGYHMKKRAEAELDENIEKLKVAESVALSLLPPFGRSSTTIDETDFEYEIENLFEKASETSYITAVFEVKNRGLKEIVDGIQNEMREWFEQGLIIVCCELVWSTPMSHRDIQSEVRLKNDVHRSLRLNNHHVLNVIDKKNFDDKIVILPESVIEEVSGRKDGCYMGSYRRYYNGLLPYTHNDTKAEHKSYWALDKKTLPADINWPIIASQSKTAVLMLNLICLRFDEL